MHRDIKPGNLMLREEDGSAVLLDFGAARQAVGQRSKRLTTILTPGYAPIEQYDGKADDVGPWSDVYALGMVAYRCVSGLGDGELPDAVTRAREQRKGGAGLTPAAQAGKGRYGPKLLAAIDWALEVDEEARPQGVAEWRPALAGAAGRQRAPGPARKDAARAATASASTRAGMGWSGLALGLAVAALLGASVWLGWQLYREMPGDGMDEPPTVAGPQPDAGPGAPAEDTRPAAPPEEAPPGARADRVEATVAQAAGAGETDSAAGEAEQPEREPVPPPEEDEVARLLKVAEADLAARRLTSPVGNNAWEKYQQVLKLAPAHPEALEGTERVIASYMDLFGAALEREEFEQASGYLDRIRGLHPDSPSLLTGKQRLQDARQARQERLAEQKRQRQEESRRRQVAQAVQGHLESFDAALQAENLQRAARSLTRVRELNPEAPGLTVREQSLAALRQQLTEQAIRERWAAFEAAMEAGNVEEATRRLDRVRDLSPGDRGLSAGEQRLATLERQQFEQAVRERWAAFEAAFTEGNLDAAEHILSQVRDLSPGEPGLAAGEQRLEAARAELKRKRQEARVKARKLVGEMVSIPGGTFRMGDLSGTGFSKEKPVHAVTVKPFWLGKHEVTFAQWGACVADGGCGGYRPDNEGWGRGKRPVINVSWNDAQSFIDWLNGRTGGNYRLPTEAEWEYAARAGSATKYSWGNSLGSNRANCSNYSCGDSYKYTAPVGSFPANAWGLHDMHGNVWEWVQDCWNESYQGAPTDGSAWESDDCAWRVIRGGAWASHASNLRSANRYGVDRASRDYDYGFRLAQDE